MNRRYTYGELTDVELEAHDIALDRRHSDAFILWLFNVVKKDHPTHRSAKICRTAYAMRKGWGKWKDK